jgi:soluble lytic murein transglycosylase-like protein
MVTFVLTACSPRWVTENFCPDCTPREAKVLAYGFTAYWQEMARRNASPEAQVRLAAREFGIPESEFVRVIQCESGMNPRAVNSSSGALGLGQHLPRYWGARAAALGYSYGDWSDARANARVSAWLWATEGPHHWVCW